MNSKIVPVETVKRPLKRGEYFSVPCITREENDFLYITPVINHPHSDKENGQQDEHYHADYRFVRTIGSTNTTFPSVINRHSKHYFLEEVRHRISSFTKPERFVLPVINEKFFGITPVHHISHSKLKHKCIHKGKCPHRGYDLSQVKAIYGKITCPLHGLQFDETSKKLINNPTDVSQ